MGGGAWPFLVGELICLVKSVNEQDYLWLICILLLVTVLHLLGTRFD